MLLPQLKKRLGLEFFSITCIASYQNEECPLSTKYSNQPKRPRHDVKRKQAYRTQNQSIYCSSQSKVPDPESVEDPDPALVNDPRVELPDQTHHKVPHRHALGKQN